MSPTRRELLQVGGVGFALSALGGCGVLSSKIARRDPAVPLPSGPVDPVTRLIGRATFGHRPGDVARVAAMGSAAYVDELLRADQPRDPRLAMLVGRLEVFELGAGELEDFHKEEVITQLQQSSMLHAIYGENPLQERMVDLWSDHFNIYALKGDTAFRKSGDDLEVIRKNALGKFPDMLKASAHSPAMLGYLDSQLNRKGVANENYARELMELHTLGVHGGYTQKDVQEVARCLTGWTIEDRFFHRKGEFRFDPDLHDDGEKIVLGHRIPAGGGQKDGEKVLDLLANHPSTAKFIATKLCRYFLGATPDAWVKRTADTYLTTGGDIKAMLRPILLSQELIAGPPMLKRPLDLLASSIRATGADTDGGDAMRTHLIKMGQSAYGWPMPDGYPMRNSAWTGSMLPRWNFAYALTSNAIHGTLCPTISAREAFEATHGRHPGPEDRELVAMCERSNSQDALALCLASPSFQWR